MRGPQGDHLLNGLVQMWIEKIRVASERKKVEFQNVADEAMQFYAPSEGNFNFVYRGDREGSAGVGIDVQEPSMRMTLHKVAEIVDIFGPLLYAKNPIRQVNPRPPSDFPPAAIPDPFLLQALMQQEMVRAQNDQLKCDLLTDYLNWTPTELGLKEEVEKVVVEALIKGRGCAWTVVVIPPGSDIKIVGSEYDSVDFVQIDPDAEKVESAYWLTRQRCHPVWYVEQKFGLKKGSLKNKGGHESYNRQAEVDTAKAGFDRQRGLTNDLMVYWEVYSRMGCGGRLSGSPASLHNTDSLPGDMDAFARTIDPIVGDYVYLAIAPNVEYPLNLPPEIQNLPMTGDGSPQDGMTVIKQKLAWPVPFYYDKKRPWPVTFLDFHTIPRSPWPRSHIKSALGELRFLCWAYSFVAGKIKNTLRDIVAILKEMSEKFKLTVLEGADLSMVELDTNNRDIKECIQVLQFPPMNADIWRVIEAVEKNFDKRVALNEAYYGEPKTQERSATATAQKEQSMNIRPEDMAEHVETWSTDVARKEAIAARMLLAPKDVLPRLGMTKAALWATHLSSTDPSIFQELEYRIEAGSSRKPNKDRDQANADSSMQILLPVFDRFAQGTGQLGPINALIAFWCKTRDVPPGPFLLPSPPPPTAPGAGSAQPGGGSQETASSGAGGPKHAPGGPS